MLSLGYDSGSAHIRISAMRLLRELPELESKVEEGSLNLTLLAQAQTFIRKEEIRDVEQKRQVLAAIEGKSTRDAQRALMGRAEVPERHLPERVRPVSESHSEIRLVVDEGLLEQLKELQALLAHSLPGASIKDVIQYAVSQAIEKNAHKEPKLSQPALHAQNEALRLSEAAPLSEAEIKRRVWARDCGRCGYVGPDGRKCGTRRGLEFDHVVPLACGGETAVENLRLRCRPHNRLEAIQNFGHGKVAEFVPAMR